MMAKLMVLPFLLLCSRALAEYVAGPTMITGVGFVPNERWISKENQILGPGSDGKFSYAVIEVTSIPASINLEVTYNVTSWSAPWAVGLCDACTEPVIVCNCSTDIASCDSCASTTIIPAVGGSNKDVGVWVINQSPDTGLDFEVYLLVKKATASGGTTSGDTTNTTVLSMTGGAAATSLRAVLVLVAMGLLLV